MDYQETQREADRPTILEICQERRWPAPVSHADGVAFFVMCEHLGIRTNVDECEMAQIARGEMLDPWPPDQYPPAPEWARLMRETV